MEKTKRISELLKIGGHLAGLNARSRQRSEVLNEVRAALPLRLAQAVVSAGVEQGRLTIGVAGSVWASRIRYLCEPTRVKVGEVLGMELRTVRVRVVPPPIGT
jgi:Dna[CI] antecedent, DciA